MINVKNTSTQALPFRFKDLGGVDRVVWVPAEESVEIENVGTLHPYTESLLGSGVFKLVSGSILANVLPAGAAVGVAWDGVWRPDVLYPVGRLVEYNGVAFLVRVEHVSSSANPPTDNAIYKAFAIVGLQFNISASSVGNNEVIWKSGTGWAHGLIGDAQVATLSIGKVTGLEEALLSKVTKAGDTMTGFLTLHADPTDPAHAATKAYTDLKVAKAGDTMTGFLTLHAAPTDPAHAATKAYADSKVARTGSTMTGFLILHSSPTAPNHASNKAYADSKVARTGDAMTGFLTLHAAPTAPGHAATKAYTDSGDAALEASKVAKAGDTMTGFLILHAAPTDNAHAATKAYADSKVAKVGDTMTGFLALHADPTDPAHAATKAYADSGDASVAALSVAKAGDTMTGFLALHAAPTDNAHAATKAYADSKVAKAGDTMTGFLALHADPTDPAHAATKAYADSKVAKAGDTMTGFLALHADPTDPAHAATKAYIDSFPALKVPENFDADAAPTLPTTYGGDAATLQSAWRCTTAGVVEGLALKTGDILTVVSLPFIGAASYNVISGVYPLAENGPGVATSASFSQFSSGIGVSRSFFSVESDFAMFGATLPDDRMRGDDARRFETLSRNVLLPSTSEDIGQSFRVAPGVTRRIYSTQDRVDVWQREFEADEADLDVGQAYVIEVLGEGDFSNVGADAEGVVFTATGTTPTNSTDSIVWAVNRVASIWPGDDLELIVTNFGEWKSYNRSARNTITVRVNAEIGDFSVPFDADTVDASPILRNVTAPVEDLIVGMAVSGAGIPVDAVIEGINEEDIVLFGPNITLSVNATATDDGVSLVAAFTAASEVTLLNSGADRLVLLNAFVRAGIGLGTITSGADLRIVEGSNNHTTVLDTGTAMTAEGAWKAFDRSEAVQVGRDADVVLTVSAADDRFPASIVASFLVLP